MAVVGCRCGKRYRVADSRLGSQMRCQQCGGSLAVIAEEPAGGDGDRSQVAGFHAQSPSLMSLAQKELEKDREAARPEPRTLRDYAYILLLAAMLPLAVAVFSGNDSPGERLERLEGDRRGQAMVAELKQELETAGPVPDWIFPYLPQRFYDQLPDQRVPGALLARGTYGHWLLAMPFAAGFLVLIAGFFPKGQTSAGRLLRVGLFTATVGILILLGLQVLANATRGVVMIGGILSLPFWALKLLAGGYDIALDPNTGFVLSALGFTVSVGIIEEGVKALPILYFARKQGGAGGWRSMCVLGLASGAGFGISEGIQYCSSYYNGIYALNTYLIRFMSCVALHTIWSGSAGIFAYQQRKQIRQAAGIWARLNVLVNVTVLSVLLHGLYDTLLKKGHDAVALAVALVTIGVLAAQIEFMRRQEEPALAWKGR